MGETTKIGWTDHTFNPWVGCTKVSAACDNCYAEKWAARAGRDVWGHGKPRQRTKTWGEPVKWDEAARLAGVRRRVFCASLADVFDAEVPPEWRSDLFALIDKTPNLDWLLLTKRPKVMADFFCGRQVPANVWAGTTVESQSMARARIGELRKVGARIRFLSVEPMLEEVSPDLDGIHWVICGGESGPGYRRINPAWVRSLRDQCTAAGVTFFFKQWGGRTPEAGGKILDGRMHCEFPQTWPPATNTADSGSAQQKTEPPHHG